MGPEEVFAHLDDCRANHEYEPPRLRDDEEREKDRPDEQQGPKPAPGWLGCPRASRCRGRDSNSHAPKGRGFWVRTGQDDLTITSPICPAWIQGLRPLSRDRRRANAQSYGRDQFDGRTAANVSSTAGACFFAESRAIRGVVTA